MLGFRGHFSTKSRRYSTTFGALRADHAPTGSLWPTPEDDTTLVLAQWRFAGQAYQSTTALSADAIRPGTPPLEPLEGGQP